MPLETPMPTNVPPFDAHGLAPRGYGAVCTAKRLAYRAARRLFKVQIVNIVALDLTAVRERPLAPPPFEFRFLSADEVLAATGDPANDLDGASPESLGGEGAYCLAALDHGRLANYSWYTLGHSEPEHSFGVGLSLSADTAYLYKAFTLPAYRGQRLHEATIHHAAQFFGPMGIRRLVAMIEYANWPSQRSHHRIGCRRVGRLYLVAGRLARFSSTAEAGFVCQP